jgi:hypothetical protein
MSTHDDRTLPPLVVTIGEAPVEWCREAGLKHVHDATHPSSYLDRDGKLRHEINFFDRFVILIPEGGENLRDTIAINLGDERCRWAHFPLDRSKILEAVERARPMWTDEIAGLDDIPEPGPRQLYKWGIDALDKQGQRIELPTFMPIVGPYGSGKSVLLRQILISLWRQHRWKFLLTAFEEKVKPRYQHAFRRHLPASPSRCGPSRIGHTRTSSCGRRRSSSCASATRFWTWSACVIALGLPSGPTTSRSSASIPSMRSTT